MDAVTGSDVNGGDLHVHRLPMSALKSLEAVRTGLVGVAHERPATLLIRCAPQQDRVVREIEADRACNVLRPAPVELYVEIERAGLHHLLHHQIS